MPAVGLPFGTPLTLQFTPVLVVPFTVAVNCCVAPRKTEAVDGETLTLMGGGGGLELLPLIPQPIATSATRTGARENRGAASTAPSLLRNGSHVAVGKQRLCQGETPFPPRS